MVALTGTWKRVQTITHKEFVGEGTVSLTTSSSIVLTPAEVHGVYGSINFYNAGSSSVTIKLWQSNKEHPSDPLTSPNDWYQVGDDITIMAGSKQYVIWNGRYKYICITGASSSGTCDVSVAFYLAMGVL